MDDIQSDLCKLYPLGDKSLVPVGVDEERYSRRFLEDSRRLFANQGEHLEIMRVLSGSGEKESYLVESASALDSHIKINTSSSTQDAFYLIPQQTSWGPLRVSSHALRLILASHHVFIPFLDFVQAYGSKRHADQRGWSGARWKVSQRQVDRENWKVYEFCYNLQYVELNGRSEGVPWSLRQCAVYQQVCLKTQRSSWILLHASTPMRATLDQALKSKIYKNSHLGVDSMLPHMIFLSATMGNWQDYLEYLGSQLAFFDEKACFSSVDRSTSHDYSVTFLDSQNLQLFRQKLLRISTVLDSCLDVIKSCEAHCCKLIASKVTDIGEHCLTEMTIYTGQIHNYRCELHRIIQYSSGTSKLLFTILGYRESKTLQGSNHAIKDNLDRLQLIASQIQYENIKLARIAREAQKEAKRVQFLSIITIMYLPASLVATIFSSSLLQSQANDVDDPTKGSHIVISSQFWIFVVTSIGLAVLTLAYPLLWDRRVSRVSH